jgi:peroxiredoxin
VVLGLNVWDKGDIEKVKNFVKKHKLTYRVMIDKDEKVFKAFTAPEQPRGVPTNAVVNKNGVITYLQAGFDEKAVRAAVRDALK